MSEPPRVCLVCRGPLPFDAHGTRKTCGTKCSYKRQEQMRRAREQAQKGPWKTEAARLALCDLPQLLQQFALRVAYRNQGHTQRLNRLLTKVSEPQSELALEKRGYTSGGIRSKRPADAYIVDPPSEWV